MIAYADQLMIRYWDPANVDLLLVPGGHDQAAGAGAAGLGLQPAAAKQGWTISEFYES
jgi:hypothetical protein